MKNRVLLIDFSNRLFGLDLMRATAIILVVLSHIRWLIPSRTENTESILSTCGTIGVEIFFVLSGYLIGSIFLKQYFKSDLSSKSILNFWKRRWLRTLPNYYLILIVKILIFYFYFRYLPKIELWKYFFFIHNFNNELPLFFMESWSLSIEEFSYLLLPLSFVLISLLKNNNKEKLSSYVILLLITLCFGFRVHYNNSDLGLSVYNWNHILRTSVIYRIDAIFFGVLAANIHIRYKNYWNNYKPLYFLVGFIILILVNTLPLSLLSFENYSSFWNVYYFPINSIAIGLTLPLLSSIETKSQKILFPITFISVISYSIYLIHYSIILYLMKYYFPTKGLNTSELGLYIFIYLSVVIICSYLLYRFFEKPIMDLRN